MSKCLYEQVGGGAAIEAATKKFYDHVHKDPAVAKYFTNIDMNKQIEKTANFIAHAAGGPAYKYRPLKEVHAKLGITAAEFDSAWGDMEKSLNQLNMSAEHKQKMKELFYSVKGDVVTK